MEPKETESETEAQKSDVCNEVHEHLTEPKQIETETGPNESENVSIGSKKSDVWRGDGVYTTDESEEYEDNDTKTEESYVRTEDSEGDSNSSYESYQLVIENCETKTETGEDCDVLLCPQCSNSKEERPSNDGSFEGFNASEIIPKLCSDDEYNKSDGLDDKFDTVLALDIRDNVRKTVHDAINESENETDNGEPERKQRKVPVVDLSASKVTPKFMADLKKMVNKNVVDALEAEDLLPKPKPLPVIENRRYQEGEFVLTRYEPNPLPTVITEVIEKKKQNDLDYRVRYFNCHRTGYREGHTEWCIWEWEIISRLLLPKERHVMAEKRYVRIQIFEELLEEDSTDNTGNT